VTDPDLPGTRVVGRQKTWVFVGVGAPSVAASGALRIPNVPAPWDMPLDNDFYLDLREAADSEPGNNMLWIYKDSGWYQLTGLPDGTHQGQVLTWNATSHKWVAADPTVPPDTLFGHVTSTDYPRPTPGTQATGRHEGEAHLDVTTSEVQNVVNGVWTLVPLAANYEFVDVITGVIYGLQSPGQLAQPQLGTARSGLFYGNPVITQLPATAIPTASWHGGGTVSDPLVLHIGIPA
jgi:hypothetical protein